MLPVAIRKREREQKYRGVSAEVLLMAGKDATATGAGRAGQTLVRVLPKATLAAFPALDHFGPENKPEQVAAAVSAFFSEDSPPENRR
jgi:pimeloyl-ACP methyl ester carboxylesterase